MKDEEDEKGDDGEEDTGDENMTKKKCAGEDENTEDEMVLKVQNISKKKRAKRER